MDSRPTDASLRDVPTDAHLEFLLETSDLLVGAIDVNTVFDELTVLVTKHFGRICFIDLVHGDHLERVATTSVEIPPELGARIERISVPVDADHPTAQAVRSGADISVDEIDARVLAGFGLSASDQETAGAAGYWRMLSVPLKTHDRVIGAMTVVRSRDARDFSTRERALLHATARRAASSVEHAHLFEEAERHRTQYRRLARTLEQALRPADLPTVIGLDISAVYEPLVGESNIGGDFYDIHRNDAGWVVVVGDVSGKGAEAAALTAASRFALRAMSTVRTRPADILAGTNDVLTRHLDDEARYVTAAVCVLVPREDHFIVTMACAGHSLPWVFDASGTAAQIDCRGTPLGLFPTDEIEITTDDRHLDPGDTLVALTDGITETRTDAGFFGDEGVAEALSGMEDRSAGEICDRIFSHAVEARSGPQTDDMAIVAVRNVHRHEPGG